MTSPAGRAAIEIVGDTSKLASQLQRDVDKALKALKLNVKPLADQIADGLKDGIDRGARAFDSIDDAARRAGDASGDAVARAFERAGERAEAAFREMDRTAGREFAKIATKAAVASKSVDSSFSKTGKQLASALLGGLKSVVSAVALVAAIGSTLAPLTSALLATGKAIAGIGKGLASLAPLTAFIPSLVGSLALVVGTMKLAGPGLATAFAPIKAQFVDLEGNATAITKTLQNLISRGVEPLSRAFVKVNLPTIIAAMDQIAIATNGIIVTTGKWINSVEGQKLIRTIAESTAAAFNKLSPQISTAAIALGRLASRAGDRAIVGLGDLIGKILDKFTAWADSKAMEDINAGIDKIKNGLAKSKEAFQHVRDVVDWVVANQGALKTFSTALGVFGLIAGVATGNPFAVLIAAMGLLLGNWEQVTKAFSDSPLAAALPAVKDAVASIVAALQPLLPVVTQVVIQVLLIAAAFAPLVATVVKVAAAILPLLVPALQLVLAVIAPLLPVVTALADVLGGALGAAAAALVVPLTALAKVLAVNPELVWILVAALVAWKVATLIQAGTLSFLTIAIEAVRIGVIAWTAVQWLLNAALAVTASPVVLIIAAIALLVAGFVLAWKHSDRFRQVIIALWHGIESAGKAIGSGFLTGLRAIGSFFASIGGFVAALPGQIGGILAALPGIIGRALAAIPGLLASAFVAMFKAAFFVIGVGIGLILAVIIGLPKLILFALKELPFLVGQLFAFLATNAVKIITTAFNAIVAFAVALPGRFMAGIASLGSSLASFFSLLWAKALGIVVAGGTAVVSFVQALPGRILAGVQAIPGIVANAFNAAMSLGRSIISSGIDAIVGFVVSLPSRLVSLGGAMRNAGVSLIQAFLGGLKAVGGFFSNVGSSILSGLKSGLNSVIRAVNRGIDTVDHIPFVKLPRIPQLATGGLTTGEGLANLHPKELVLPLEDSRAIDLLGKALAEADAGLRATGVVSGEAPVIEAHFEVRNFFGDKEFTDIIRTEISESNRGLRRRVQAGAGSR